MFSTNIDANIDACEHCGQDFVDNIRIGTRKGLICVTCYEPHQEFYDKLTDYDKKFLAVSKIGYKV